jgi:hypothetical protein
MTIATTVKFESGVPMHAFDFASQNKFNFTSSAMDNVLPNTPVFSFSRSVPESAPHGIEHAIVLGRKGSSGKLMVMVNPQCAATTCDYSFITETVSSNVIQDKCERDFCHISVAINETLDNVSPTHGIKLFVNGEEEPVTYRCSSGYATVSCSPLPSKLVGYHTRDRAYLGRPAVLGRATDWSTVPATITQENHFQGWIRNLAVYDTNLTEPEILQLRLAMFEYGQNRTIDWSCPYDPSTEYVFPQFPVVRRFDQPDMSKVALWLPPAPANGYNSDEYPMCYKVVEPCL